MWHRVAALGGASAVGSYAYHSHGLRRAMGDGSGPRDRTPAGESPSETVLKNVAALVESDNENKATGLQAAFLRGSPKGLQQRLDEAAARGDDRDAAYWLRVWESGAKVRACSAALAAAAVLRAPFSPPSQFHMFTALALLAVPLTRRPNVVGTLWTSGALLFSGSCYVQTLTVGEYGGFPYAPLGGGVIVLGWLALL